MCEAKLRSAVDDALVGGPVGGERDVELCRYEGEVGWLVVGGSLWVIGRSMSLQRYGSHSPSIQC